MANPYPINPFLRIVVKVWMSLFTWHYRIKANILSDLKEFDQPYLLLSNHYGRYDPFIISHFIKKRPNFISSDAILRDKVIGTLFKGLGAMPKKKGLRDSHIIREMVKVVQSGGSLALFPEGTRTWSGETLYIDPSIAKLVKLLKVPLVTARMKGAYAFDPRWAKKIRRAEVEIDYNLAIKKEEIVDYSEDEILKIIRNDLYQDDIEYQLKQKIKIRSRKRAEYLDKVLFQCPECEGYDGYTAEDNYFTCRKCNQATFVDKFGFFSNPSGKSLPFNNIKDWLNWQNKNFVQFIKNQISQDSKIELFHAEKMHIEYAIASERMQSMGTGSVYFYPDRLKIIYKDSKDELLISEISSLGPQFHERIELFYNDRAYRLTSTRIQEPGIKWELAINVIWAQNDMIYKLSPYFKDLILSVE